MGKSYKKHGCCPTVSKDGEWKRIFNRRLRRVPIDFAEGVSTLADGGAFKKANETWEISDGKCRVHGFADYDEELYGSPFAYRKVFYCK